MNDTTTPTPQQAAIATAIAYFPATASLTASEVRELVERIERALAAAGRAALTEQEQA